MNIENNLHQRAGSKCELCGSNTELAVFAVQPVEQIDVESCALLCLFCREQIEQQQTTEPHHWHCLNESAWSEVPAVKVLAWRMLNRLQTESWAQDLLDMLYLDDSLLTWAKAGESSAQAEHKDCNGAVLNAGDSVTLVKNLKVKGGGFTAKQGTAVRNISLVADNPEQIEGRVEGQKIVILTQYVKKSSK